MNEDQRRHPADVFDAEVGMDEGQRTVRPMAGAEKELLEAFLDFRTRHAALEGLGAHRRPATQGLDALRD